MNKKTLLLFIIGFAFLGSILSYVLLARKTAKTEVGREKMQIVASFYPLYYFASQIAGDKANVINITPAGVEPHDFEPSTQDIALIERAALLVVNGGQFEPWGDKIKENLNNKNV